MRLLFIGVSLEKEFQRGLLASGFQVDTLKAFPKKFPEKPYELIITAPRTKTSLKEIEKLGSHFKSAWIVILLPRDWLKSAELHNAVLESNAYDDIWFEADFPHTFWLSLKKLISHKQVRDDYVKLQAVHHEMMNRSQSLVDQIEQDVELAANIQRSLLPRVSPDIPGVSLAVKYIPAAGVGGDYYDIFEFGDRKRFGILVADSKTHGMAAALLSTLLKVRLEEMKDRFTDSHFFVEFLNREIQQFHKRDLAPLSLLYGIIDRSTLTFRYTVAGPLQPLLWRRGAAVPPAPHNNPPLGELTHYVFSEQELQLKPGDLLVLHTDGLDTLIRETLPTANAGLSELLAQKPPSPDPLEVRNELMALVDRYQTQGTLKDDLTLIQLSVQEKALYVANSK